jgi:hypothetical protein
MSRALLRPGETACGTGAVDFCIAVAGGTSEGGRRPARQDRIDLDWADSCCENPGHVEHYDGSN